MAPREVVFGMDKIERNVSLFGVAIAIIVSLVPALRLDQQIAAHHDRRSTSRARPAPRPFPSSTRRRLCEHILEERAESLGDPVPLRLRRRVVILFFALRRKRAGVACFACFLGIGLGISGVVFVFLGAWLIVRAFRLQRYGEASWTGSNKVAREMAQARREGRDPTPKATSKDASAPAVAPGPAAPPSAVQALHPEAETAQALNRGETRT